MFDELKQFDENVSVYGNEYWAMIALHIKSDLEIVIRREMLDDMDSSHEFTGDEYYLYEVTTIMNGEITASFRRQTETFNYDEVDNNEDDLNEWRSKNLLSIHPSIMEFLSDFKQITDLMDTLHNEEDSK